jgi:hypothetical protein
MNVVQHFDCIDEFFPFALVAPCLFFGGGAICRFNCRALLFLRRLVNVCFSFLYKKIITFIECR